MFPFDINLDFAIYNGLYHETLEKVKKDLIDRSRKVAWVYQRDNLTDDQLKRVRLEEEHIRLMGEFIDNANHIVKIMMDHISDRQENQIIWYEEWKRQVKENYDFTEMMISKYKNLKK